MSEPYSHVRLYYSQKIGHYFAEITTGDEKTLLDLGEDEENMKKVVKVLREEFGGIPFHPGQVN